MDQVTPSAGIEIGPSSTITAEQWANTGHKPTVPHPKRYVFEPMASADGWVNYTCTACGHVLFTAPGGEKASD